ncbi:MOS1T transposase, partial [Pseudoatta argentina]
MAQQFRKSIPFSKLLKDAALYEISRGQALGDYCFNKLSIMREEYVAWEQRCHKLIESLEEQSHAKRPRLSIGKRQSVTACIARHVALESARLKDSGWILSKILNLIVNVNKHNILRAGCYFEMPREIILKETVISVRSTNNACFAWSVVTALYPAKSHADKKSLYPHYIAMLNLQFPIMFEDIKKFEHLNAVSINAYGIETKQILRLRLTDDKKENHTHTVDCGKLNDCAVRLPSEDDRWLAFGNYCNQERVPFVIYADLECILCKSPTRKTRRRTRSSRDNSKTWHRVKNIVPNVLMETLSKEQATQYDCHIYEKPFVPNDTRVRNHWHLTGRYRGPAHSDCNLNYKNLFYIQAYDGYVDVLPITKEKYISFIKHVDSKDKNENNFQKNCIKLFLNASLDKWHNLKIVRSEFSTLSDEEFELLTCKGVFSRLPPRKLFYSSLSDTVSESDYAHAVNVWSDSPSECEYNLYLKTDILLLADIFENFCDLPFCSTRDKPLGKREDKLLAMVYDKQCYIIHYCNLQQCTHYSFCVTKFDYHLFRSMQNALSGVHFRAFEEVRKRLGNFIASKDETFFASGICKLPER